MDPDACWRRWQTAVRHGDVSEAADAHDDLCSWIARGGFSPGWTYEERVAFFAWEEP